MSYDIVIPTVGRPSLGRLLSALNEEALWAQDMHAPRRVFIVDDRAPNAQPLEIPSVQALDIRVICSGGLGPAAARNRGWHATQSSWVSFLDDDVMVVRGWMEDLAHDLDRAGDATAAIQGSLSVPMPVDRRPTDRERSVAGLAGASWITADLVVRREALRALGGFDERFPRAYREDTDFVLRLVDAGWVLERGRRRVEHPVGPAGWTASLIAQRGNADDALMDRLHGPDWRSRASAPRGAFASHVLTSVLSLAFALSVGRRGRRAAPKTPRTFSHRLLASLPLFRIFRFTAGRIAPGPRSIHEVAAMAATSPLIPFLAVSWRLVGRRRAVQLAPGRQADQWHLRRPRAVLFDRDGTLITDVPYNGDPSVVQAVPGAAAALDRLRAEGIPVGIVSNQSAVARGLLSTDQVDAVNARVERILGPFSTVQWCPHRGVDLCACRKPEPGLVLAAAAELGVAPWDCAVIGDIGRDVAAGLSAGARSILVPNARTRAEEIAAAPEVAVNLASAVDALLGARRLPTGDACRGRMSQLGCDSQEDHW